MARKKKAPPAEPKKVVPAPTHGHQWITLGGVASITPAPPRVVVVRPTRRMPKDVGKEPRTLALPHLLSAASAQKATYEDTHPKPIPVPSSPQASMESPIILVGEKEETGTTTLPALLDASVSQKATHEDTYPKAAPTMPAPDIYPGVLGDMQQAPLSSSDNVGSIGYETNMAAFEAQDRWGSRPASSNVGYPSIKSSFRR